MSAIVVVTTVGTEEQANVIAHEVVARRQACCVNLLPHVRSLYRWRGKICQDSEYVLMIKTLESEFDDLSATIKELHSYDLPEILAFRVTRGDKEFLDWIESSLDKEAAFDDEEVALPVAAGDD